MIEKNKRLLEILPGAMTWGTILLPIILSLFVPEVVMIFLVLYTTLWFIRSLEFSYFLIKTYKINHFYTRIDWQKYLTYFSPSSSLEQDVKSEADAKRKKFLVDIQQHIVEHKKKNTYKEASDIFHIVVMATYKEDISILRTTINKVAESVYDSQKIILLLAGEERDQERFIQNATILEKEFSSTFAGFYSSMHPKNIVGETPGKGSNISYAAKKYIPDMLKKYNLVPENVLVTTLDADNCVHPLYFANVTFFYLLTENRGQKSYQPLPLFYNNIWDVPMLNRVIAFGSSFWHMIESGRPDRLRNFSSHAQSLDALIKTDYWSTTTIVEDGHQYWRSYFIFKGNYSVVPIFIPIYQDAVQHENYTKTLISQYKQLRRWAWGCSDIPFVIQHMIEQKKEIPFKSRVVNLFRLIEGHYMWATAPIIITLTAPIPRMINPEFAKTTLSYNMGLTLSYFFSIAFIGVFIAIWVSLIMAPPFPKRKQDSTFQQWWLKLSAILQWFLLPLSTIIFGALPAIESQTRLMLGKYLDFQVTEKIRTEEKDMHTTTTI